MYPNNSKIRLTATKENDGSDNQIKLTTCEV